jgi:hypothetical protein
MSKGKRGKMKSDYAIQAEKFLSDTQTGFKAEFIKNGKHFEDDKDSRDIYKITLTRGNRVFSFNFGQSLQNSGRYWKYGSYTTGVSNGYFSKRRNKIVAEAGDYGAWDINKNFAEPTPYDVLACLTKYDVGSFENFCSDFGYDTDSRKAEKTYKAVLNEYKNVCALWNEQELEALQEIN